MKRLRSLLALVLFFAGSQSVFCRPLPTADLPMKRLAATNSAAHWHSIAVAPSPHLPKIHLYDKFNPLWWLENADDPVPPDWYRPHEKHRELLWRFRNPFHNWDFYVAGIADKKFTRSGRYPERNSAPGGGLDFEVTRRHVLLLPFISYTHGGFNFYLGWRERGNFGMELKIPVHASAGRTLR